MVATAEIRWASKDEAVARTFEKTERGFDAILRKLDQVEKQTKKTTEATTQGFDASIAKVGQFIAGFAGVGSVVAAATTSAQLLKREWENLKSQQKAAADANLQLADVLPSTFRQAGGILSGKEIEEAVKRISGQTGVGQVNVAQAIGEALAARGATNKKEAQGAVSAAAAALRFAPEADPQTIAALAGGTTDLQRRFGVSAEQSIGFLARVGGQARVTSLREQVQNINPAIGGLAAFGFSPQAAGGLVSSLTGASGDFTGAMSATASISLAKQLEARGFKPQEGIAALQADPRLREAFFKGGRFGGKNFEGATFEARMFPFIRELLTGGSALAQNYAAATREVGTFEQGGATYEQMIREVNALSPVRLARIKRGFTQGAEGLRLSNIIGAEGSISREGYQELIDASGAGALEKQFLAGEFEVATAGGQRGALPTVAKRLRQRAAELTATQKTVQAGFQGVTVPVTPSEGDIARGDALTRMADLLESILRENQQQTGELKKQGSNGKSPETARPPEIALGD